VHFYTFTLLHVYTFTLVHFYTFYTFYTFTLFTPALQATHREKVHVFQQNSSATAMRHKQHDEEVARQVARAKDSSARERQAVAAQQAQLEAVTGTVREREGESCMSGRIIVV
jgi:hypothetical protein